MTHQTAEEVRERHVKAMGDELGELFYLLKQQLFQQFVQWNEYVDAFGTNEERIALLNKVAGGFARSVQDALWADVLLGLTRITDPPKSVGKDNLSIARIPDLLDGELKESVAELVKAAADATAFARDWRKPAFSPPRIYRTRWTRAPRRWKRPAELTSAKRSTRL